MVFRAGRVGRPGLLGAVARTAVVTGTASATANAVNRRAQQRAAEQQPYPQQQAPDVPPPDDDLVGKLQRLGELHASGALSDEEFAAAKAQLLR
ncbi:SHOCT domain-containing protein [Nocardia wallacei]|uniref:SHOCT domain-containing protein n=1 Tax=Nocardia wallacei TaxID=480035 RepID=UPI0024559D00|nr:SHOCT domain-containing protein [Nocardia wallacei]